jgi:hypothetical protein
MVQHFDIFKSGKANEPIWLETAQTLKSAIARVNSLRNATLADFMILS